MTVAHRGPLMGACLSCCRLGHAQGAGQVGDGGAVTVHNKMVVAGVEQTASQPTFVGQALGAHLGRVAHIDEQAITVDEWLRDDAGVWHADQRACV